MKTFNDLVFNNHLSPMFGKRAELKFDNGYGVSVLIERGGDRYELAVLQGDDLYYSDLTDYGTLRYTTEEEVTKVMEEVQKI